MFSLYELLWAVETKILEEGASGVLDLER